MKQKIKSFYAGLTGCLFLLVLGIALPVCALESFGQGKVLLVSHRVGEQPVAEVEFSLYAVGTMNEEGEVTFADPLKDYGLVLKDPTSGELKNAADILQGYLLRDQVEPVGRAKTDEKGIAGFSVEGMNAGVYLLLGKSYESEAGLCRILPILLYLQEGDVHGETGSSIRIESKYEIVEKEETQKVSVLKVWRDETSKYRPSGIEAQLIDNDTGEIQDTVVLDQHNNWRHTWEGLPPGHAWSVVEKKVPAYYTVTSERKGSTVKLINDSDKKAEDVFEETPAATPTDQNQAKREKLPQTGTFRWLVPVLAAAGVLCLLIGLIRRQKDE